jgi:hypothetical protein
MTKLSELTHPEYNALTIDWERWRRTYEADDDFANIYLKKFSARESDDEFASRREITYVPAFSASAVDEIKEAIFQRISDVTRKGGKGTYEIAIKGEDGGIDLSGSSMNSFIGSIILPELLTMKKVGVFVDMPELNGASLSDQQGFHPYLYHYKAESVLNWEKDAKKETFTKLLLVDSIPIVDDVYGLTTDFTVRYRLLQVINGKVLVIFFNSDCEPIREKVIDLPEIPFVNFQLPHSLLKIIDRYQIALMNIASSDMSYILKANFPFYTEQYDPRVDNLYAIPGSSSVTIVEAGEQKDVVKAKPYEIELGTTTGRRIPKGLDMPKFIHPSSEPIEASMKKQEELKRDIRLLVRLNVANLSPKMASGESKSFDERSLEAGLSAIGLELQHGERQIAKYWQWYEDRKADAPTVIYPSRYSLQSDKDKRQEAKDLKESTQGHPSITYKKEVYKICASSLIGSRVSKQTIDSIDKEIEDAEVIVTDSEELNRDVELTLIDPETASKAKGYPKGVIEKAKVAHAERVARIAESQAKARGVNDLGGIANASRDEKVNEDEVIS